MCCLSLSEMSLYCKENTTKNGQIHKFVTFFSLFLLLFFSDVLALPIFKQEESNLPPESDNKILPFQYVLCAATSPAVKLHDETLTYLNQGLFSNTG